MHPLDGPRLKIRRAESEIGSLARAEEAFRSDADYEIVRAEFNPKSGKYVYRVRINITPDLDWGVSVGEIAHNLRSALDGLVWQLALLDTKTPASNTQFPIFLIRRTRGKRPGFEDAGRRYIRSLRPNHQAIIEGLQPYQRKFSPMDVGRGRNNVLYLLHEINNADKHRLLQVVGGKPGITSWGGQWGNAPPGSVEITGPDIRVLKDGAKLMEAAVDVAVYPKFIPLIAFWQGCPAVRNKAVVFTFGRIARWVSDIVESFAPDFP